ncbi:MAG: SpoIID/LytB domain-containing protein [bacterium]|nr:SpoIID/LytB domain-containing protein [bacterium]
MKLSVALNNFFTFALAFVIVITAAGVFSLVGKNLLQIQLVTAATQQSGDIDLRAGHIGEFGYIAPLPQGDSIQISHLPEINQKIPAVSAPARTKAPQKANNRPWIRVGLYDAGEEKVVASVNSSSKIVLADGSEIKKVAKDKKISIRYNRFSGKYIIKRGLWRKSVDQFVRIVPEYSNKVITIHSYENRPTWNTDYNDNQFLGMLEMQYASSTDKVWMINELGIENYVKGVSEAGDINDIAYLKTLYTAARSYVNYHYLHPTKHADEPYLVDTTANDQVYRGYGFTQRAPNIAAAVDATRGKIIHYNGVPVVTPYFSQTDGRTRAWSEVWSGDYPYLNSVNDPCCTDEELLGHGVGLSAKGARYFAEEKDWGWKKILKYYYQGITLNKLWN